MREWLWSGASDLGMVVVSAVGIYLSVVLLTRISGLRSFSKMSSFDFAMTVAVGSLMATTLLTPDPSLVQGAVGAASLYLLQFLLARFRLLGSSRFHRFVDNEPLLLMDGPRLLHGNMDAVRVTESDLYAKLREANVLSLSQVRAVVMETTGDISVLHTEDADEDLEDRLLTGVNRDPAG